jgi:class 3 adenylate cyclase/tetratricopeptide (TPR) repeat protein
VATDLQKEPLSEAREAFARHAWIEALDHFVAADARGLLAAHDLEAMGESAWWTGRHEACIAANERAFAAYLEAGNPRQAAMVALTLMVNHAEAGARSVAGGWLRRAIRLLENEPDCPEKGHLELRLGIRAHGKGELDEALEHEGRALDLGMRFGDRDLQGLTLCWQGKSLLLKGQVDEGMSLLEEATAAAVGGELSPRATGVVYCMMIATCQQLADYSRAGEWTEAARRWCERQAISGFPGICRVHRAEIIRLRGRWEEAELEARRAHEELRNFDVAVAGDAMYEIGEVRLRMGDLDGADQAFRQAHELAHPGQPGLALLSLERGDADAAAGLIAAALEDEWHPLYRARYLPVQVEAAVAGTDLAVARTAADEMEKIAGDFRTEALEAIAASARGQVQFAEGDPTAACRSFARSWNLWKGLDAPYEAARARRLMAEAQFAKGDTATALLELRAAKAAFDKLGAVPESERCHRLLRAHAAEDQREGGTRRALVTFMFTDIVSSTSLIEVIGDESWRDLQRWHDQTLRGLFEQHGGREVDHAGDGFFVSFEDPAPALQCAIAIQRKLAEHRRVAGFAPQVRIGLHAGEALAVDRDFTGRSVHQAARIGALAVGGEILASIETIEWAGEGIESTDRRDVSLKGFAEAIPVASIAWR